MSKKNFVILFVFLCLSPAVLWAEDLKGESHKCMECHEKIEKISAVHEDVACLECHLDGDTDHDEDTPLEPANCEECHEDEVTQTQTDIHRRMASFTDEDIPNCATCHNAHDIELNEEVEDHFENYCSSCHENMMLTQNYHSLPYIPDEKCTECHDKKDYHAELADTPHSKLACVDCHIYITENLKEHEKDLTFLQKSNCDMCHKNAALEHKDSVHGISLMEGIGDAALCTSCHGVHKILDVKNPESPVSPNHLARTCSKCHEDPAIIQRYSLSKACCKNYDQSIHGMLMAKADLNDKGELKAPTCVKCHGVHDIKNRVQPGSSIASVNVPDTCGECHQKITEEYQASIHWIRAKKGDRHAPVCNDCHNEHEIQELNTASRGAEVKKIQEETCINCHKNPQLLSRYGLNSTAVQYQDSYHGLATTRGDKSAAYCIDCHNPHKILPKEHKDSSVSPMNVTQTCQNCHKDATVEFSRNYSHKTESPASETLEYWVRQLYVSMIFVVIGGMLLHNMIIFIHEIREKRKRDKLKIRIARFNRNEIIQHLLLVLSFFVLVFTGFTLKFPENWIFQWFGLAEPIRKEVHRIAGVVMLLLGFYHIAYMLFTPRGRQGLRQLLPLVSDMTDFLNNMLYYLHLKKKPPEYGNFDYMEKAEYWALIWGTMIMGLTGIILWNPTLFSQWIPYSWVIKISEIVHFYEAILATLAIVVWHFFFVMLHPKEYPVSFTMVDGQMSLEHYKHHHTKHFRLMILEAVQYSQGKIDEKQLSYLTQSFINSMNEQHQSLAELLQKELEKDQNLKDWIEQHLTA
ncbi:MAG: cytochrome c3 family protein [SAR324 cluster bacterium]|nr:cytochrome c3 family protein [SAR324 cluster bacterium]